MIIQKNGFVKCEMGSWTNISKIISFAIEQKEKTCDIHAVINEEGVSILVSSYSSREEAEDSLNLFMNEP